jgi:hypothetical protein
MTHSEKLTLVFLKTAFDWEGIRDSFNQGRQNGNVLADTLKDRWNAAGGLKGHASYIGSQMKDGLGAFSEIPGDIGRAGRAVGEGTANLLGKLPHKGLIGAGLAAAGGAYGLSQLGKHNLSDFPGGQPGTPTPKPANQAAASGAAPSPLSNVQKLLMTMKGLPQATGVASLLGGGLGAGIGALGDQGALRGGAIGAGTGAGATLGFAGGTALSNALHVQNPGADLALRAGGGLLGGWLGNRATNAVVGKKHRNDD